MERGLTPLYPQLYTFSPSNYPCSTISLIYNNYRNGEYKTMNYLDTYEPNMDYKNPALEDKGLPLQLSLALTMLLSELDTKMPVTNPSVATTLGCIERFVYPLPRTRKKTFDLLLLNGFYRSKK
tara:strand:+ start:742 stop:1113 length:372 start_codon:yes stop_codon:yes gene_type:complete